MDERARGSERTHGRLGGPSWAVLAIAALLLSACGTVVGTRPVGAGDYRRSVGWRAGDDTAG